MYKVVVFDYECGYFISHEQDFDSFVDAINYASFNGCCYIVLKNYSFITASELVARSSYESWSPLK